MIVTSAAVSPKHRQTELSCLRRSRAVTSVFSLPTSMSFHNPVCLLFSLPPHTAHPPTDPPKARHRRRRQVSFLPPFTFLSSLFPGACGKTSLLCSFALGRFPKEYVCFNPPFFSLTRCLLSSRNQVCTQRVPPPTCGSTHLPAVFDNYVAEIKLDEKPVQLALWDTACVDVFRL
jgi:hypothetical protein